MADNEESRDDHESGQSSPNSTAEPSTGLKAQKDRSCPFCGQSFTSSSLGRHLDLYIKPKNPKPADGVHDVNEIRKIRGGITRRQARTGVKAAGTKDSSQGRDSGAWASIAPNKPRDLDGSTDKSPESAKDVGLHTWFNAANWQATGVINNLPPRAPSRTQNATPTGQALRMQEMRNDSTGNRIQRPDYGTDDIWKLQESAEVGRVAEMALREVLGSLEAAKKKAEPRKLYEEFDFCCLAFPGLCLAMLPPPPTLFSSTPFPIAHTWSLSPPGEQQKDAMVRLLNERIASVRNGVDENVPESVRFRHRVHLDGAYEHWERLSENERVAAWNLEVCRAFVKERDKTKQLSKELEVAQQRINHLEAEYDRLSRCQLPREYLLHPPNTLPVSPAVMKEMKFTDTKSGAWEMDYDVDALLNKWKTTVKATTRPPRPPQSQPQYIESTRSQLKGDIVLNGSVFGVNGAMPRDFEGQGRNNEPNALTYEIPRNPDAILAADETGVEEVDGDMDAEAEAEAEDKRSAYDSYANQGALRKLRNTYGSPVEGILNANGKRPLGPSPTNGRNAGPKVYREQPKA